MKFLPAQRMRDEDRPRPYRDTLPSAAFAISREGEGLMK